MVKKFFEWLGLKERIDSTQYKPPLFKEGEIWWCYIGENIGVEINGKSDQFTRPVLVLKKYDGHSFLGLPLTSKLKQGTWYVPIHFSDIDQSVVLAQGRTFDCRRFKERMGQVDDTDLEKIQKAYLQLHISPFKIDPPPLLAEVVGNPKHGESVSNLSYLSIIEGEEVIVLDEKALGSSVKL